MKFSLCCFVILLVSVGTVIIKEANTVYTVFSVHYPDAHLHGKSIYLRGDNCKLTWNKGLQLTQTDTDLWQTALLCPEDIKINVKALLNDTTWMYGKNKQFIGGVTLTVDLYPSFNPTANKVVDTASVHSKILNNSRKCSLYYPPSYYDNPLKQYEVLIMHDGQNLFNNSQAAFGTAWLIQNAINSLTAQGSMRQILVVGVWNTADRNNQYTYSVDPGYKFGGKGDLYLDFLQKELIPIIETQWFNKRITGSYGIGGSSLGGLISCYASYTRPNKFTTSVCMSSSFWWNNQDFNNKIISTSKLYDGVKFYVDSGDSGTSQDSKNETLRVYDHMAKIGYKDNKTLFHYVDKGGQHNEYYWGRRFYIPMTRLYP